MHDTGAIGCTTQSPGTWPAVYRSFNCKSNCDANCDANCGMGTQNPPRVQRLMDFVATPVKDKVYILIHTPESREAIVCEFLPKEIMP